MIGHIVISQEDDKTWSVKVDGKDFADAITGCTLRINGAGEPAELIIRLTDLAIFTGSADLKVDGDTAYLLAKLGWTPPRAES